MAQVGKDWDLYRLSDAKVAEVTADSSSSYTTGTSKDLPGIVEVAVETEYETVRFEGDDKRRRIESRPMGGVIRVRCQSLPMDARTVIEGGTVTQTDPGSGDSKSEYLAKATDAPKYFKLSGLVPYARNAGAETGKTAVFNVYKAKIRGNVRHLHNAEPFNYEFEAEFIPNINADKLWDITGHEDVQTLS